MSNTIRHKRGTSDPGSSDFASTAELLVNTANGGVFAKTDGGSVVKIGPGATVANDCIYENSQTITADYTITTNKNAMSAGPITVNSGITVTVPSSSTWTVV